MKTETTPAPAAERLVEDYVDICNRAMAENMDRFLFRQAKRLNRKIWDGADFHTVVYDEHPERVVGEYTLRFDPDTARLRVLESGDHDAAFSWRVPLDYLNDVVNERPQWYLAHPIMLDGVWIADRVRDEFRTHRGSIAAVAAGVVVGAALGALSVQLLRERL